MPSSTASLEIAAGVKGGGKGRWVVIGLVAIAAAVGAFVFMRRESPAPRAAMSVQRDVRPPPSVADSIPSPPTAAAAGTPPAPASSIPSTSFADLPHAAPEPPPHGAPHGWTPPRSLTHHEPPPKQAPAPAAPAASSSNGHYGLFE
jgi:hypothetical protein